MREFPWIVEPLIFTVPRVMKEEPSRFPGGMLASPVEAAARIRTLPSGAFNWQPLDSSICPPIKAIVLPAFTSSCASSTEIGEMVESKKPNAAGARWNSISPA